MADKPQSSLRGVMGTNTSDVMSLFGGTPAPPGSDPTGLFQTGGGTSVMDIIKEAIARVSPPSPVMNEMPPMVPRVGTPAGDAPILTTPTTATPAEAPATGTAQPVQSKATPLPAFQGLPPAPDVVPPIPVPVYDQGAADAHTQNALTLANTVQALSHLFGGGNIDASGPGLIAGALAGNEQADEGNWLKQLQQYQLGQDAQTLGDARVQRHYGQQVKGIQTNNQNAQNAFTDTEGARRTDALDAYRNDALEAKLSATQQTNLKNYRRYVSSLNPAAQEAELQGAEAQGYGLAPQYDTNGQFIPLTTQKDATNQQNADTRVVDSGNKAADIKSKIAYRAGILTVNGRKATVDEVNAYNKGKLTDSQIKVNDARITKMAADTKIAQQRADDYKRQVTASADRVRALIGKAGTTKDPTTLLLKVSKEIKDATERRAKTMKEAQRFAVSDNPDVKASYGRSIDEDTKFIQATRVIQGRLAQAASIQASTRPTIVPSGGMAPAKVSVQAPKAGTYEEWLARGKKLGVPVGR